MHKLAAFGVLTAAVLSNYESRFHLIETRENHAKITLGECHVWLDRFLVVRAVVVGGREAENKSATLTKCESKNLWGCFFYA